MKKSLTLSSLTLSLMLVLTLALPAFADEEEGGASGLSNELKLFLDGQGGEWKNDVSGDKGENAASSLGIGYVHFFKPLETTDAPHAMRQHLQHPSTLEASLVSHAFERDWDGSITKARAEGSEFSLGGMYHAGATGLGARLTLGAQELKIDALGMRQEDESSALELRLDHYTSETTRLRLALSSGREKTDDLNSALNNEETKDGMLRLGVSALINKKIWLSGELGTGRSEYKKDNGPAQKYRTGMMELQFGYFFSQELGLMVSLEGSSYENKQSGVRDEGGEGKFSVGVEYYPSESGYFGVSLVSASETQETATEDFEMNSSGLRLQGGFLF